MEKLDPPGKGKASRKRVLRRRGRPRGRSVDSERAGRVIELRKRRSRGGRRSCRGGRQHRGSRKRGLRLHRSRRAGHASRGTTGTWEVSSPLMKNGSGNRKKKIRGLDESRACDQEPTRNTNKARTQRTAERRKTKRSGMGDEKSETLVVPRKRGTRLTRTRGGKGRPAERLERGKDVGDTELRKQLNETSSNSGACEEASRACVHVGASRH